MSVCLFFSLSPSVPPPVPGSRLTCDGDGVDASVEREVDDLRLQQTLTDVPADHTAVLPVSDAQYATVQRERVRNVQVHTLCGGERQGSVLLHRVPSQKTVTGRE